MGTLLARESAIFFCSCGNIADEIVTFIVWAGLVNKTNLRSMQHSGDVDFQATSNSEIFNLYFTIAAKEGGTSFRLITRYT